eukprot:CAMPEP_0184694934 /NCGR_PEP_ID=MMETSP0313-20130426/2727_1 /TAXON_ID=2792 /ORGANISM="Porphyridium aerugineum, Strain SAG 1380-2" /LENGTH=258 /DNA_ID=CAMNT_0027153301 /DNA_START=355 /DNA_END=1131 /DNA_ORIENTATION=+
MKSDDSLTNEANESLYSRFDQDPLLQVEPRGSHPQYFVPIPDELSIQLQRHVISSINPADNLDIHDLSIQSPRDDHCSNNPNTWTENDPSSISIGSAPPLSTSSQPSNLSSWIGRARNIGRQHITHRKRYYHAANRLEAEQILNSRIQGGIALSPSRSPGVLSPRGRSRGVGHVPPAAAPNGNGSARSSLSSAVAAGSNTNRPQLPLILFSPRRVSHQNHNLSINLRTRNRESSSASQNHDTAHCASAATPRESQNHR